MDEAFTDRGAWKGDIEAAAAGEQSGFEHFERIVEVHARFGTGAGLEVRDRVFGEVVGEVVDEEFVLRLGSR
ncbi:hypothetical protein D9M72_643790 [compost metagenome]